MPEQKFNQPYYKIQLAELDDDIMGVVSFEGEEEISGLFEFRIQLASLDPKIDSAKILNKPATFTIIRPDQSTREIHGYISSFEQTGKSRDYIFYKVVLVPRLWQLGLIFQNEIFQNLEIDEMIAKVLEGCKLSGGDLKVDLKNKPPKIEFMVQYRETNLNFLNRRLEHYGIYYYFDQSGDEDVVCFTDDNSKLPAIDSTEKLGFNENREPLGTKESIFEIICREKVVTGSVQLKDYNYMFPEKQLMAQSQIDSKYPGTFYDYGDNFENEKEADSLAKIRNQEILCQSKIFYGNSDCRLLSAGYKFSLDKHYRDDWNSEYIITSITHKGNQHNLYSFQHSATKDKPYENNFTAIPVAIDFRPVRRVQSPKIYGIMNAKIDDSTDGKYASIDEHGRYKVKLPFDLSDKKNGEASHYIRMAQSYSGENYGIHFPLHKGAEVLLTFVDGNPDRPVISGTVPNPSNASPVKGSNQTQSVIRTAGNNEIVIEDSSGEEQIHINQACGNEILLDGNSGKEGIQIRDKYGNEIVMDSAAGTMKLRSPSHESVIELGKSIYWGTLSNLKSEVGMNANFICHGYKDEWVAGPVRIKYDGIFAKIHGGIVSDTYILAKNSNFYGGSIDTNIAYKRTYNLSYEYKRSAGRIITRGTAKEDKELQETVKIDSAVETKVIGGGGTSDTSKIVLNGDKIHINCGTSEIIIKKSGDILLKSRGVIDLVAGKEINLVSQNNKVASLKKNIFKFEAKEVLQKYMSIK